MTVAGLIAREAARIDELLESHLSQLHGPFDIAACDLASVLEDTCTLLRPNLVKKNQIVVGTSVSSDLLRSRPPRGSHPAGGLPQYCDECHRCDAGRRPGPCDAHLEVRRVPGVLMRLADGGKGIAPEDGCSASRAVFHEWEGEGRGPG